MYWVVIIEKELKIKAFCSECGLEHQINFSWAKKEALNLLSRITRQGHLDLSGNNSPDSVCELEGLFARAGGKMFGVLLCHDQAGNSHFLYAFSGQINGRFSLPGWVPPLFDEDEFALLSGEADSLIKKISGEMDSYPGDDVRLEELRKRRKQVSRIYTQKLFQLYRLYNFRSEERLMLDVFKNSLPPTGTGDCCTPRLLVHAARNDLVPYSLAEVFCGASTVSGSRIHGQVYMPCVERCQPLLGFLLCGLSELGG